MGSNHHVLKLPFFSVRSWSFIITLGERLYSPRGLLYVLFSLGLLELLQQCPCLFFLPFLVDSLPQRAASIGWDANGASGSPWSYSLIFSLTLDLHLENLQTILMCLFANCQLEVLQTRTPFIKVSGLLLRHTFISKTFIGYCTGAKYPFFIF